MRSIDVDTDVFARIWSLREAEESSENDVLRRLLLSSCWDAQLKDSFLEQTRNDAEARVSYSSRQSTCDDLEVKTSDVPAQSRKIEGEESMGKVRWVDDVRSALSILGGRASLYSIYREVERIRKAGERSVPKTLEATIRRTLEDHSSDSANFRGADLFANVARGEWSLR